MALLPVHAVGCMYKQVESPEARPRNAQEQRIISDFKKRVDHYEDVSERVQKRTYPVTSDVRPAEIHKRQQAMADGVIKALPGWKQGAIFTPEIADFFRARLKEVFAGPDGASIKAAIEDDDPGEIGLKVMAQYPTGAPVTTVPLQMLKVLPALPKEVEYRFLGGNLILMDEAAFLIIDFIPNAYK
ncbi:MAG: hypothetical protein M3R55_12695 [Acidobacteriota bacterium]|nr:hypothetical protein [Acidobacteriota bacterium]